MSSNRIAALSSNPTLTNFARDASQASIRKVARFIAPLVTVPTLTGRYKVYDAKHRYKRPNTRRSVDGRATRIGFDASDASYNLEARALDFPIPNTEKLAAEDLLNMQMYGAGLLADAAGLDHEAQVIDTALTTVGAGTDVNFLAAGFDPIARLDTEIVAVKKLAKNGAAVKVLFGPTAVLRIKNNAQVIARFNGVAKGLKVPNLADISAMLFGNPACEMAEMVQDTAAEGKTESIDFLLDDQILIFASNDQPNTMDPSFMKTLVPMGGFFVPGEYMSEDERDRVLKMDWFQQIVVTNSAAAKRINAKDS
jgi:hypothetical protein